MSLADRYCQTCGKRLETTSATAVNCAVCEQWWHDNPPPAQQPTTGEDGLVERLRAEAPVTLEIAQAVHGIRKIMDPEFDAPFPEAVSSQVAMLLAADALASRDAEIERWHRAYEIAFDQAMENGERANNAIAEIARLEAENFALAAGQCIVDGGLVGDEHGHAVCTAQAEIAALKKRLGEAVEVVDQATRCAYPVSTEINERGHNWSEAYLDEMLPRARAFIDSEQEKVA